MKNFSVFLNEAVASDDKLKHLTHAEEHIFNAGASGYAHATKTLHAVHQAMQGKPSAAHITVKYDGSPSIVFGHHPTNGKFFVASKSAFNVNPKINYTNEDIEANHGHAPGLVEKLKQGLKHLPKVAPNRGVYQGDVMHSGARDVKKVGGDYHFKPQLITYTTPQNSLEGRKIADSKFGVAVHTQYKGNDLESMKATFKPDAEKAFKQHADVHVLHPTIDPTQSQFSAADSKKFQEHMDAAEAAHAKIGGNYSKFEPHAETLKMYVNRTVDDGSTPSHEGYKKFLTQRAEKDIDKLKSDKGKAARKAAHDLAIKQLDQNKKHFNNLFDTHNHIAAAKNVLVHALHPATQKFGTEVDGQKVKGEGTVVTVDGKPTKLVDRAEFSRLNRLAFESKKKAAEAEKAKAAEQPKAEEQPQEKHGVVAFGRMNPPTEGHVAVANKVLDVAKKHNADAHTIVLSHTQNAKKDPLSPDQKVRHALRAFPAGTHVIAATKDKPTILHHAAEMYKRGITHLHVVGGSDRQKEYQTLLDKYNGVKSAHGHYNFKSITVHSSGQRDPDAEGVSGISATKMRDLAAKGDKKTFIANAPKNMQPKHKEELYNDVRKGMNINEMFVRAISGRKIQIKKQLFRGADMKLHRAYPGKSASSGGGGGGGSGGTD